MPVFWPNFRMAGNPPGTPQATVWAQRPHCPDVNDREWKS